MKINDGALRKTPLTAIGVATWALLSYILLATPSPLDYGLGTGLELARSPDIDGFTRAVLSIFLLVIGLSFIVVAKTEKGSLQLVGTVAFALCLFPIAYLRPDLVQLIFVVLLGSLLPFACNGRQSLVALTSLHLLLVVLLSWRWYQSSIIFASSLYYVFALFAMAVSNVAIREQMTRQELANVNAQLLATQRLLTDSAIQSERLRISRDLHDSIGHHLTALSLQLEVGCQLAQDKVREPLERARAIAKQMLADVREVVKEIRSDSVLDIRQSLLDLTAASRTPVSLEISDDFCLDQAQVAEAMFRFVQEAITNNNRHSLSSRLFIVLDESHTHWTLSIDDDLSSPVKVNKGSGLAGMRERAEALGGNLKLDFSRGLSYRITLPKEAARPR